MSAPARTYGTAGGGDALAQGAGASGPEVPASLGRAALSGLVAAAVALGAGELLIGLVGTDDPSLVYAVATEFIDLFGASLKDLAVDLFGTNHKLALIVGIVVVSLLLGAAFGALARRRFGFGAAGFVVFGAVGFWAYRVDELGDDAVGLLAALTAVGAGVGSLWWLLRAAARATAASLAMRDAAFAPPVSDTARHRPLDGVVDDGVWSEADGRLLPAPVSSMELGAMARRAFLGTVAALGAGAAAMALVGRRIVGRGASEKARADVVLPSPRSTAPVVGETVDLADLSPYITPNDGFYRIDTAVSIPQTDLDSWRLRVDGLVDRPFELTHAELLAMPSIEQTVTIACVSNPVGGRLVGNAVWQGVALADLLERAGVQAVAQGAEGQVVGRSLDGWTAGFPMDVATDGRVAMVAYAMNGEPLPVDHGFPARLIVAGLYGYVSATKWLSQIEVARWDDFDGYWVPRGWAKEGPVKTMARIDVPSSGADLASGTIPVAGVAWAPTRGISAVEVRIDDGEWNLCDLGDVASENTWVQWTYEWAADPGDHVIAVRATDGDGVVQTSEVAHPAPDGASGWHGRRVSVV